MFLINGFTELVAPLADQLVDQHVELLAVVADSIELIN